MATRTENYHLVKPDRKDSVNVGVLNNNWDITDAIVADLQAQHDAKVAELSKQIDGMKTDLDNMAKEIMGYIERGKNVWTEKDIPINASVVQASSKYAPPSKITAFKYGKLVVIAFSCTLVKGIGSGGSAILATGLPADLRPYGDSPFSGHGIRFSTQPGNGGYTYGGVLVVSKTSITACAPQVVNSRDVSRPNISDVLDAASGLPVHLKPPFLSVSGQVAYVTA